MSDVDVVDLYVNRQVAMRAGVLDGDVRVLVVVAVSIDGELPAVTSEIGDPVLVEVTAGSIFLDADLVFNFTLELRQTENGTVSTDKMTTLGTFTFVDPQGAFTSNPGGDLTLTSLANQVILTGEIDGSQLFLQDEEHLFVFEK